MLPRRFFWEPQREEGGEEEDEEKEDEDEEEEGGSEAGPRGLPHAVGAARGSWRRAVGKPKNYLKNKNKGIKPRGPPSREAGGGGPAAARCRPVAAAGQEGTGRAAGRSVPAAITYLSVSCDMFDPMNSLPLFSSVSPGGTGLSGLCR